MGDLATKGTTMSNEPRPRRLPLRLISASVLVLGIMTAFGSLSWRGARFPGFLVMPNRVVPSAGLPSWSGVSDGQPPYQEVLLAVDDTPVTSAADAYRRAAAHRVGEPARYTFARDGVLETHTYPLRQLTDAEYFAIFGAYFIAGLAHSVFAVEKGTSCNLGQITSCKEVMAAPRAPLAITGGSRPAQTGPVSPIHGDGVSGLQSQR